MWCHFLYVGEEGGAVLSRILLNQVWMYMYAYMYEYTTNTSLLVDTGLFCRSLLVDTVHRHLYVHTYAYEG